MTETELLRTYRRDLHQIPELDTNLPLTLAYVEKRLADLKDACTVIHPCTSTVCALFAPDKTPLVAVRTDMDALPVDEQTGASFASKHPGRMHACGHDGHMAMALGLCNWLATRVSELSHGVMVVFQPAEETSGGAQRVCQSGVFRTYGVERIFGCHLWPDLPKGTLASRPGPLLASSNEVDVTFTGVSSHIAKWKESRDALRAATTFVNGIYGRIDSLATDEPVLLRFGTMRAGTVRNAIAASAEAHGSLRAFSTADRSHAMHAVRDTAKVAAEAYGCSASVHFSEGNPPVVNDAELFLQVRDTLPDLRTVDKPLLIAEDFAWYQQELRGVFFLLGTGTGIPLHASTFDFDESILQVGLDAYKHLVR